MAVADQGRAAAKESTLDGATQTLPAFDSPPATDWNDITSGSNGGYQSGPGYDEVTGLGTPKARPLMPELAAYGIAGKLVVTAVPPNVSTGIPFALTVEAETAGRALASGFVGSVTVALANNPGESSLGDTRTLTAKCGAPTFTNLLLNHAAPGDSPVAAAGGSLSVTTGPLAVTPAAPVRVVVLNDPSGVEAIDSPFAVGVSVMDAFGNVVS
jgi:hypothetical protein